MKLDVPITWEAPKGSNPLKDLKDLNARLMNAAWNTPHSPGLPEKVKMNSRTRELIRQTVTGGPAGTGTTLLGLPVEIDPKIPDNEVRIRYSSGFHALTTGRYTAAAQSGFLKSRESINLKENQDG